MPAPIIMRLTIERFRGVASFTWQPAKGSNVILGGGDAGKTTILDAIGLLLNPTNAVSLSDADYFGRTVAGGFKIEAVMSLPPELMAGQTHRPSWPWEWKNGNAVPPALGDEGPAGDPVYILRVSGTSDLELLWEIVQPNGETDFLSVGLRRAIGVIRLGGDDRNDRDLRLVQGSALDRLLSDRSLRSRLGSKLAKSEVKDELDPDAKKALAELDTAFKIKALPDKLDLAVTGAQGVTITALIGLTADKAGVQLPLANWGSGTRRLAALAIAEQTQDALPITIVDEVERGLEPYRQRGLMQELQDGAAQTFLTTHSASVVSAATNSSLWYLDHKGNIGPLDRKKIADHQKKEPETFLARLSIIAEGATEVGFVNALLEKVLEGPPEQYGIRVSDGGGHETALGLLEALSEGGLMFGGFADDESGKHPQRWRRVKDKLGPLLFRWDSGCLEVNLIRAVPADRLEDLIQGTDDGPGSRLRTLADRLGLAVKEFATIKASAGDSLVPLIIEAALGQVPTGKDSEKKTYSSHAQTWFKTPAGGRELADKLFSLGLWPTFKPTLMPFLNAVRGAVGLPPREDIMP